MTETLRVESSRDRDALEQCGLATSVFADEEGDGGAEIKTIEVPERWDREGIFVRFRYPFS
jgi:hypothetical protein